MHLLLSPGHHLGQHTWVSRSAALGGGSADGQRLYLLLDGVGKGPSAARLWQHLLQGSAWKGTSCAAAAAQGVCPTRSDRGESTGRCFLPGSAFPEVCTSASPEQHRDVVAASQKVPLPRSPTVTPLLPASIVNEAALGWHCGPAAAKSCPQECSSSFPSAFRPMAITLEHNTRAQVWL